MSVRKDWASGTRFCSHYNMEIRRFFVKPEAFDGSGVVIDGEEFRHAVKVLRQKVGFTIIFNTGDGCDYYAEITEISKDCLTARLIKKEINVASPRKQITLYQGSLKCGKNDFVAQKAVELGVSRIVFFDSKNAAEKNISVERLRKIAVEAMKQCGRADSVTVEFKTFAEVIAEAAEGFSIMPYELEASVKLSDLDYENRVGASIIIGSEGGFDKSEAEAARQAGVNLVSLGRRILRAETAAIAAVVLITEKIGGLY